MFTFSQLVVLLSAILHLATCVLGVPVPFDDVEKAWKEGRSEVFLFPFSSILSWSYLMFSLLPFSFFLLSLLSLKGLGFTLLFPPHIVVMYSPSPRINPPIPCKSVTSKKTDR